MSRTRSSIPRPADDVLRQLYVDQKLGCPDIGRMFERDPKTVFWWLRQAGIPTRPRGSDERQHFKRGHTLGVGRKHSRESRKKIGLASVGRAWSRGERHWLRIVPPEMNPNWKGGATPERQEFYRSKEWKSACRAVWGRANACCERCGLDWRTVDRRRTATFHVHHIVSFAVKALRAELINLALLCRPCHLFVHGSGNVSGEFLRSGPLELDAANNKEAA